MKTSYADRDVAIVTGAEQGLGARLRDQLQAKGYHVLNVPAEVCRGGNKANIDAWIWSNQTYLTHIRVIINNFGINHLSWIGATPAKDEEILLTNVMAPYWLINGLVKVIGSVPTVDAPMRVVNVASQTYRIPQRTTALYCASKAALVHLTTVMARELAEHHWIINAVAPGKMVDTEMSTLTDAQVNELRNWTPEQAETYALQLQPMNRFTTTHEVADAIMKLLTMPSYVNGTTLDITGAA